MEEKTTLSKLMEGFKKYPQVLINAKVTDKNLVMEDEDIINAIKEAEAELSDDGRVLVRASGTEPIVRVMVEADSEEKCNTLANKIVDLLKSKNYLI